MFMPPYCRLSLINLLTEIPCVTPGLLYAARRLISFSPVIPKSSVDSFRSAILLPYGDLI